MVFPVMLSGKAVEIKQEWCRGCDVGSYTMVQCVKGTGKKGKYYCASCWDAWFPMLTVAERGEGAATVSRATSLVLQPPWPTCKVFGCAELWKKAKHHSGYCSYSCAIKHGWTEETVICQPVAQAETTWKPEYTVCNAPKCADVWKKAKHHSGYCSYSCAVVHGWVEETVVCQPVAQAEPIWTPDYAVCNAPGCAELWKSQLRFLHQGLCPIQWMDGRRCQCSSIKNKVFRFR